MIAIINQFDWSKLDFDERWNGSKKRENGMHELHAYPAKFPAFIASETFRYAKEEGVKIHKVADIFCGCGTVALEAKLHGYDFFGTDINPVATLLAKVKSETYDIARVEEYGSFVKEQSQLSIPQNCYKTANARLQYWFTENSYQELYHLKAAIAQIPEEKYKNAFLCLFSSILKPSSKWLSKSIKPQVDPNKKEVDIPALFWKQYNHFIKLLHSKTPAPTDSIIDIRCENFLTIQDTPKVDLIVTSPPYVTSYEYADLHQLSSLWLGYVDDFRSLREGSIGSVYNNDHFEGTLEQLNSIGKEIVEAILKDGHHGSRFKSIIRYYLDMEETVKKCYEMLNKGGMVLFVVGDTECKNVKVENSKHLVKSLQETGFCDIKVTKRKIANKILTPYRDEQGRFTKDKTKRVIYHEEFVISGRVS